MTRAERARAQELVNTLDFDGLTEALDKVDNMEISTMIIDRMFSLDEERAIAFAECY